MFSDFSQREWRPFAWATDPLDKVNRKFRVSRPNALWVVDFMYVHTWAGFVCLAFVIDACARRPGPEDGLIRPSNPGVQYLAMNYTLRLAEAKLVPSVGSIGDSYDNALAKTINGLYKVEVI